MTHDPLCHEPDYPIARKCPSCQNYSAVREDERDKDLDYRYIAAQGEAQGQRDMLAKCITAVGAVEGGYSVPLGMSVGQFIEAMRHQFIAVLRDLEETL